MFTSLDEVYGRSAGHLLEHNFADVLRQTLSPLLSSALYIPLVEHPYGQALHSLADLLPSDLPWGADRQQFLVQLLQYPDIADYLSQHEYLRELLCEPGPPGQRNSVCAFLHSSWCNIWLNYLHGHPLSWTGRYIDSLPRGSLTTVFRYPAQIHPVTRPSMQLGSLEVAEVIAMDWSKNNMAVYLKSLGFWKSEGALLIPTVGSPLIAMLYMQKVLNSMGRDLNKQEIGDINLKDASSRHNINELCNFYLLQNALTAGQVDAVSSGLKTPPYTLQSFGNTYQEHVHALLQLFLATFRNNRFTRPKPGGVEAVFVLSVNHPDAHSPEIVATAYVNESTGVLRLQQFPSCEAEASSYPHVKVLEITATYTPEGTHAVRLRWCNKSMEQPARAHQPPMLPVSSFLAPPVTPTLVAHPVATPTSVPIQAPANTLATTPTLLQVYLGPPPFTACGVIISMLRFGWDFSCDNPNAAHPLNEITAGLMAAQLIEHVPRDVDGSRDEYIRTHILQAREQHHLLQASGTIPFHTYEVFIPFVAPQAVGLGTECLSHYEIAKQAAARWERTYISFQCISSSQRELYRPENRVLFCRTGNLGESNYDSYCMDGLKQAIMLLLPQDSGDILILRTGIGQQHVRPSTGSAPGKRSSRGGARVQSVGGLLTIFFDAQMLNPFLDLVGEAISGPRGFATQPQWTSLLQDPSRRHIITCDILRYNNPALIAYGLLRFDLYLTTELTKISVEPLPQACNVVDRQFFSIIHLQDVPMTQVINQLTAEGTAPPEWKVCMGMAQWQRPNLSDVPLYDFLPNRRGPCLLIITQQEARLPTIRIGNRTYPLDAYNMHPIVSLDRHTSTLGNLMYTAELPNAGHYNKLSAELCDLLRVPISSSTRPIRDNGAPLALRLGKPTERPTSYRDAVQPTSSSASADAESSLTTTSSSDHLLATLTQTLSLFQQRHDDFRDEQRIRDDQQRVRDERQHAFNMQVLSFMQTRNGGSTPSSASSSEEI